jgi:putative DNA primase/helicase
MANTISTYEAAHGRWREILSVLGLPSASLSGKPQPCPMCKGTDRFQFTDRGGEGEFICRGCGAGKGMLLLMKFRGWDFKHAAGEVDAVIGNLPSTKPARTGGAVPPTTNDLRRLWGQGELITANTAAGRYLTARGLKAEGHQSLRAITRLPHAPSKRIFPGMLARFVDAEGAGKQIQRVYLTETGSRADVTPNRMFVQGHTMPKGGAIRLGEAAEVMGVAEGFETALAAAQIFNMPVWATTSAELLKAWMPPTVAKRILVFGDTDDSHTGQAAAHELARRLYLEAQRDDLKREVDVRLPPDKGTDWNDVLRERST